MNEQLNDVCGYLLASSFDARVSRALACESDVHLCCDGESAAVLCISQLTPTVVPRHQIDDCGSSFSLAIIIPRRPSTDDIENGETALHREFQRSQQLKFRDASVQRLRHEVRPVQTSDVVKMSSRDADGCRGSTAPRSDVQFDRGEVQSE